MPKKAQNKIYFFYPSVAGRACNAHKSNKDVRINGWVSFICCWFTLGLPTPGPSPKGFRVKKRA